MQEERLTNIAFTYANDVLCDGAGSQLHRIYSVYGLSRLFHVAYYHSPLKTIGYQGMVALEKNENSLELLERYNQLFHIPSDIELPLEYAGVNCMISEGTVLTDLVKEAYETATKITDEKEKAQALIDVVNEINYFTQHHNKENPDS